jgi:hypothetical protein
MTVVCDFSNDLSDLLTFSRDSILICSEPIPKPNKEIIQNLFKLRKNIFYPSSQWALYHRSPKTFVIEIKTGLQRRLHYVQIEGLPQHHFEKGFVLKKTTEWNLVTGFFN